MGAVAVAVALVSPGACRCERYCANAVCAAPRGVRGGECAVSPGVHMCASVATKVRVRGVVLRPTSVYGELPAVPYALCGLL